LAPAAAVAVGLHLLLFSLDVDRRGLRDRHPPPQGAVTVSLVAAAPRAEKASLPPDADRPEPPGNKPGMAPVPQAAPLRAIPPKPDPARTAKAAAPPKTQAPAAPGPPDAAGPPSSNPQGSNAPEASRVEPQADEEGLPAARPAGGRFSADGLPSAAAPQPPAPAEQEARAEYERNPAPEYPGRARQLGFEGTVQLRVKVNPNGGVDEVNVAVSSGYSMLDDAALRAVKTWVFKPARRGGQPVAAWVQVPIRFALDPPATRNR
jgi:protein TonB